MTIVFHITAGSDSWIPEQAELDALTSKFQTAISANTLEGSIVATRAGVHLNIITGPSNDQQPDMNSQQEQQEPQFTDYVELPVAVETPVETPAVEVEVEVTPAPAPAPV